MRSGRLNSRGTGLRLESAVADPVRADLARQLRGVKQRASDENLCSTNSNGNSTTKEVE